MTGKTQKFFSFAALAFIFAYACDIFYGIFHFTRKNSFDSQVIFPYFILGLAVLGLLWAAPIFWKFKLKIENKFLPDIFGRLLHVLLFLTVIFVLKQTDLAGKDFERAGMAAVGHHGCRLLFAVYLTAACFGAGKLLMEKGFQGKAASGSDGFILYFFSGAFLLALAGAGAASAGCLNFFFALTLMAPLVFYGAPRIKDPLTLLCGLAAEARQKNRVLFSAYFIFCWMLFGVILFFLVWNILNPSAGENDFWAHYLPYYREVIRTGSWGPNELWNHFYVSKGAGLFHLAGALGDLFSAQLISLSFMGAVCVILFQLCRSFTRNSFAALTAVVLFLCLYDGSFLKHHTVLTGCIVFLVWAVIRAASGEPPRKIYEAGAYLGAFYLGFYQPIVFFLMALSFFGMAAWFYWAREPKRKIFFLIGLLFAGSAGMALVFWVNFWATGMFLDSPIRFFWNFADKEHFLKVMGPSGLSFFMQSNSDIKTGESFFNLEWIALFLRAKALLPVFPAPFLAAGLFFAYCRRNGEADKRNALALCVLFAFSACLFGLAVHVGSLSRLYSFMIFFSVLFAVFLIERLLSFLPDVFRKAAAPAFFFLLAAAVFLRTTGAIAGIPLKSAFDHAVGRVSFAANLAQKEEFEKFAVTTSIVERFRKKAGSGSRIFDLGNNPGPAFSFPGRGLVSEPTYTLGPDAEEILFGPPDLAKKLLKRRGFNYFITHLESSFLVGLPFSPLFNNENIGRHFRVVDRVGGAYLLSWMEEGPAEGELPPILIQMNELKRTAASSYPFSEKFEHELAPIVRQYVREGKLFETNEAGIGLGEQVLKVLARNMAEPLKIEVNKNLAEDVLASLDPSLTANQAKLVSGINKMDPGEFTGPEEAAVYGIAWYVRSAVRIFYFKKYGLGMTQVLIGFSSPSKDIYESRDAFRRLLDLK